MPLAKRAARGFDAVVFHRAHDLKRSPPMNVPIINVPIEPVLALVIGILILLAPRLLNYLVAVYLIVVGILGLMPR